MPFFIVVQLGIAIGGYWMRAFVLLETPFYLPREQKRMKAPITTSCTARWREGILFALRTAASKCKRTIELFGP